jgi:hypothetical protein
MKRILSLIAGVFALALMSAGHASAVTCTNIPTTAFNNFFSGYNGIPGDPEPVNAAMINPSGTVSGDVDATGCSIGIYYGPGVTGKVDGAIIHNAIIAGVLNDGAAVTISNSVIHDIGAQPIIADNSGSVAFPSNGSPLGFGIYMCGMGTAGGCSSNDAATGNISNNFIWFYQKGGIVIHGPSATSNITDNTITGLGPITRLSQNGIEVGLGATVNITGNFISNHQYTGSGETTSDGILGFGGVCFVSPPAALLIGNEISRNVLVSNDVGIQYINAKGSYPNCAAPTTPTKNIFESNTIRNNSLVNVTGGVGPPPNPPPACATGSPSDCPYQAGIQESGDADRIYGNFICGAGYNSTPPAGAETPIDTSFASKNAAEALNTTSGNGCN